MSRLTLIATLLLLAASAKAALTVSVAPASRVAAPGAEIVFEGTLTNTSATERVFLNDITATIPGSIALKTNAFFSNVPGILLPGETYTGPLFSVKLNAAAPAADYSGTITLSGGATIDSAATLASTSVTILATPISQWRYQTFGVAADEPAASDLADWDRDGTANLLEYALGTDAKTASAQPAPVVASNHLTLSFAPIAPDVAYLVQASTDLIQWSTANVELVLPSLPGITTYRYTAPVGTPGAVFLRLRVTR